MALTKALATIAVALAVLVVIVFLCSGPDPMDAPLDISALPADLAAKAVACHNRAMNAGRTFDGGVVIDIRCYEK